MKPARHNRGCLLMAAGCATSMLVALVLAVIVLRTTFVKYHQSTINMEPTIAKGDTVVVRRRVNTIQRGDIVVFSMPAGGGWAIKRIVALPDELVELREGIAVVNGIPLEELYVSLSEGPEPQIPVVRDMAAVRIPPDEFFVLGDNRDHSNDSRFIGPVKRSSIRGRAVFVISQTKGVWWP